MTSRTTRLKTVQHHSSNESFLASFIPAVAIGYILGLVYSITGPLTLIVTAPLAVLALFCFYIWGWRRCAQEFRSAFHNNYVVGLLATVIVIAFLHWRESVQQHFLVASLIGIALCFIAYFIYACLHRQ